MRTKRCAWKSSCQEFWIQCQSNWYQAQLVLKWYCNWHFSKLTALLECHPALLILMRTKRCAWKSSCQEFWIQCQSNWYQAQLVLKWYCDWWETQEILLWVYPGQKYSQQLCPTLYLCWDAFLNVLASENFEKLWCYWVQMWWLWSRERKTCCPSIGSCRVRICVYSTVWSCICWWMQRTLW